ncbi:CBS domain-containing protein [Paeniroseomonas aquatica]|jgi:CBS domain-containing protein|uniref:CBS domain-containing protein n=1 Tax=Paeniroseomonas aquatica TaxID=373043 RepID=A0ABT8A729_9PROT|nr:CBS domain-containing protein [Paeniroseomonas aquatica]MDN3565613.1 CBS domain-containing protein [Paeniroseomonas aquatica]
MTIAAVIREKGRNVVSVAPEASIMEIATIISSRRIGAVMVLADHGGLAGIVSERDVVKALAKEGAKALELTASDLMTRQVTTVTMQTSIDHAMEIMDAGYFRHLPVMDGGELAGIVSIRDLVKHRITMHQRDLELLKAAVRRPG